MLARKFGRGSNISRVLLAAAVSLIAGAATAQTLSPAMPQRKAPSRDSMTTPLPGKPSNPKASIFGTSNAPSGPQSLKVRYLTDINNPVTLLADGLTFDCASEPGAPTPVTACTAQTSSTSVDLSATYGKSSPLTPIQPKISGKQWNGACAGTSGDTCHLTMTSSQTVGIDFYAKP
jgi:hypothetical protein